MHVDIKTEQLPLINSVVLPGEVIKNHVISNASTKKKVILGPGLRNHADDVIVSKCGILRFKEPSTFWVDCLQRLYIPASHETVVGIVTKKIGDYYKVDIQGPEPAMLHYLSFEGATKKIRPEVNVGDAVFGRMIVVSQDMEPELVCLTVSGKKEMFRVLPADGFIFRTSLHLVRKVLNPSCPLLSSLGQNFRFESAIGVNGIIWLRCHDIATTIAIANVILKAETMSRNDLNKFCATLK